MADLQAAGDPVNPASEANVVIEPVFRPVPLAGSQVEPLPAPDTPHSVSTAILPEAVTPSRAFLSLIPHEFARRHLILSAGSEDDTPSEVEHLLITERTSPAAIYNVGVTLQRAVRTSLGSPESIAAALDRVYFAADEDAPRASDTPHVTVMGSSDVERDLSDAISETERDLLSTHGKAPAVRLVDLILFEALLRDASDIHIQPVRGRTLIRYRMDGALYTVRELPGSMASALVSRIKVMAQLNVAEHRAPQDGRATVTVGSKSSDGSQGNWVGRRVDLRISTLPSTYGERVVIRLLDPSKSPHVLSFAALYCGPAHNNLGVLYLRRGELYPAAGEFEWARKLMPGHPDPRMNLAMTLESAGRTDEALAAYGTALEVAPEHIAAMQAMASLQLRTGKADDRTPDMLREIALRGDDESWRAWAQGQLAMREGR